ncbi:hypothetical protein [Hydrogenobacter thermophilus]|uniref:hypothetical protein n=1 Tax=Hydrogenobacter thermophilus TaxID=940 RepID=UPI0030F5D796
MSKIILPLMSASASGKFGDIVFLRRFGENIARIRVKPSNPNTPAQQTVRHNLSALSQAWKGSGDMVLVDSDGSITGTAGASYVKLRKWNPTTKTYTEVSFKVLTNTEKQAWQTYASNQGKPLVFGRTYFIGENQKRLMANQDPVRMP